MTEQVLLQGECAPADSVISTANAAPEAAVPNGFVELGLAPELVQAVADLGYTQPTAVQDKAIPLAMGAGAEDGRFIDLMVSSQTGSGKTASGAALVVEITESAGAHSPCNKICSVMICSHEDGRRRYLGRLRSMVTKHQPSNETKGSSGRPGWALVARRRVAVTLACSARCVKGDAQKNCTAL